MESRIGCRVGAALFAWVCVTASAQQYERIKLLPEDGEVGDGFGVAAALSGTTAVVGAFLEDANGADSGAVYLFDLETGEQLRKLMPTDGAPDDQFGRSLAITDATAVVGAALHAHDGVRSGAAYVFDLGSGAQIRELVPDDADDGDGFSNSIAMRGDVALVGAPGDDDNGASSGAAYLFDVQTGAQLAKLLPTDGAPGLSFGIACALSDHLAAVSSWDDDNGTQSGSVYLFDRATGQQVAKLVPSDGHESQLFGRSIAFGDALIVVGASLDDEHGNESGAVYIFDLDTHDQLGKLRGDGVEQFFGFGVAVSGDTLLIGAPGDNASGRESGAAYTFDLETRAQIAKLTASDGTGDDRFGVAIAADGDRMLIGAMGDDNNGFDSGSAYGFWSCPADLTGDGVVDTLDFLLFLGAWSVGNPLADWNEDGSIDTLDFLAYLNAWASGC